MKRQIYNSCVLPAMTYGAETWALSIHAKNKLAAVQTKMERSMLKITYRDRKTNIWVREKTKVIDVIEQVRRRKWTWAGHVSRIRDNPWTLRITTWKPYEKKRPRGRPARRWRDELDTYWNGTIWQRIVQDRQMWKQHGTLWLPNDDDVEITTYYFYLLYYVLYIYSFWLKPRIIIIAQRNYGVYVKWLNFLSCLSLLFCLSVSHSIHVLRPPLSPSP